MTTIGVTRLVGSLADFLLDLAGILLDIARGFLRVVTGDFADDFLHGALYLVFRAFGTVLVHDGDPLMLCVIRSGIDLGGFGISDA
jgi:hypothetical protein